MKCLASLTAAAVLTAAITATAATPPATHPGGQNRAGQRVVVILDDSGSMGEEMRGSHGQWKIDVAKVALVDVIDQLPDDTQIGLLALNQGSSWVVPLGPLDRGQIATAVAPIDAFGGTPLGRYMKIAADELLALRQQQLYGTYRMLIVTDGEATDRSVVASYLPDIVARGLLIDVIGVDMARDHSLATDVHSYRRADDPDELRRALTEVFAESSGDAAGDAGESDFAVIAALPDQFATEALHALVEQDNGPIVAEVQVTEIYSTLRGVVVAFFITSFLVFAAIIVALRRRM